MLKRDIAELAVYQTEEEVETLPFACLRNLYLEKTSDIIYITEGKKLYGIVDLEGVLYHSENDLVRVNRIFTNLIGYDVIRAHEIFQRKSGINKIPVVNEQRELLGDYSRWDDALYIERNHECLMREEAVRRVFEPYEAVYVVDPIENKDYNFLCLLEYLKCFQVKYAVLKKDQINEKFSEKAICIFLNEEERRGIQCLYRIVPCAYDGSKYDILADRARLATYKSLLIQIMEENCLKRLGIKKPANRPLHILNDKADVLLSALREKGVPCFCLYEDEEDFTEYGRNFRNEVNERLKIYPPNWKRPWPKREENEAFYGELYQLEDYEKEIAQEEIFNALNTYQYKKSMVGKYFNSNGRRITCFQPNDYIGTIYVLGMCVVIGSHVEDQYTIPSYLQKRLLENGYKYRVENYGDMVRPDAAIDSCLQEIGRYHVNDIVIYMSYLWKTVNIPEKSLEKIFEENNVPSEWVKDIYGHCNHKVNKLIADSMLEMIEPHLLSERKKDVDKTVQINVHDVMMDYVQRKYLKQYFSHFYGSEYKTVGAIVMTGNCFNKGHRYLIEQARQQVEFLIVFVVEEDLFLFPFEERFKLVEEGTKDLKNIMLVPSGDFILSRKTFQQFFHKGEKAAVEFNVEYDINVFADYIAQPLHITHRFTGEEPKKKIVKIYNEMMARILPQKGIAYIEIPRLVINGEVVSTARVQKHLRGDKNEYCKAFTLLPETTKQYLMKQLDLAEADFGNI